jgi:hypothetical protein
MRVSVSRFKKGYPEFLNTSDSLCEQKLIEAESQIAVGVWGARTDEGIMLTAAVLLSESPEGEQSRIKRNKGAGPTIYEKRLKDAKRQVTLGAGRTAGGATPGGSPSTGVSGGGSGLPGLHAFTHQGGGNDEISVAGLSGKLADAQTAEAHAASHQDGGADEISIAGLSGEAADPQVPKAHALVDTSGHTVSGLTTGDVLTAISPTTYAFQTPSGGGGLYADYGCWQDVKPFNDAGGSSSANSDHLRVLNTEVVSPSGSNISLNTSTYVLTLKPGKRYRIKGSAPVLSVNNHHCHLYRTSGTPATVIIGTTEFTHASNATVTTRSFLAGDLDLTAESVDQTYELHHWIASAKTTNGLGGVNVSASGLSTVFSILEVWEYA